MLIKDNPHIPIEDKDFFILLRIGLWQRIEEELSPSPNWEYIYTLPCEQTVQGLIADAIGLYRQWQNNLKPSETAVGLKPSETRDFIPQSWNDKFLSASAQIVRRNFSINQMQAKICKLLNEQNITI